ncbi:hypothetical protein SNEBB_006492 [Seison nebaliae]|nr:hypothetical protein SNEBB_006492 [Seison nebaliae]
METYMFTSILLILIIFLWLCNNMVLDDFIKIFLNLFSVTNYDKYHCLVCPMEVKNRFDCHPERSPISREACIQRHCCYDSTVFSNKVEGIPWCFYPEDEGDESYKVVAVEEGKYGIKIDLRKNPKYFRHISEYESIKLKITFYEQLIRVKIEPTDFERYEVPVPFKYPRKVSKKYSKFFFEYSKTTGSFRIIFSKTNETIFDSSISPLTFADQFLEISTKLPSSLIYGLGERRDSFGIDLSQLEEGKDKSIYYWNKDGPPEYNSNLYGTHPFFISRLKSNNSFGIILKNSNAMEIIGKSNPSLTYRSIGGIFDFTFFVSSTDNSRSSFNEIIHQFMDVIGYPQLPPQWSFGFHLCRFGSKSLENVENILKRNIQKNMSIDVQWLDIDYMWKYRDFTLDSNTFGQLRNFSEYLHQNNRKLVLILDAAISNSNDYQPYLDGIKDEVFIQESELNSNATIGKVWPGETVFPDFFNDKTVDWWSKWLKVLHNLTAFDGIWIDMNEPASFTSNCNSSSLYDNPPYVPNIVDGSLSSKTICPHSFHKSVERSHYDLHSLYGWSMARATHIGLERLFPNQRNFILSRSTFVGSGRYTNHWSGDNFSKWSDMKDSIGNILRFQLFGIPMIGADICGFIGDTNEELCIRWMQLGAFYPFMRNHNTIGTIDQDPASWSSSAQNSMRISLELRHSLVQYFYSKFYQFIHLKANLVYSEIAENVSTKPKDDQFLIGECLTVAPFLVKQTTSRSIYLPRIQQNDYWIYLHNGTSYSSGNIKWFVNYDRSLTEIPVFIRSSCTIFQEIGRNKEFLIISVVNDEQMNKELLFFDDGKSTISNNSNKIILQFSTNKTNMEIVASELSLTKQSLHISTVQVYGLKRNITAVSLNHQSLTTFKYSNSLDKLLIYSLQLKFVEQNQKFNIDWK